MVKRGSFSRPNDPNNRKNHSDRGNAGKSPFKGMISSPKNRPFRIAVVPIQVWTFKEEQDQANDQDHQGQSNKKTMNPLSLFFPFPQKA